MNVKTSFLLALVLGWALLIVVHFSLSSSPINDSINQSLSQISQAAFYENSQSHSIDEHSIVHAQSTNRRSLLDLFKSTQHPVKRVKKSIQKQIVQIPVASHIEESHIEETPHNEPHKEPHNEPQAVPEPVQQPVQEQAGNVCSPNILPLDLYRYSARPVDREDFGPGVVVTVEMTCDWPLYQPLNMSSISPPAYFRIIAVGSSMAALDPTTVLKAGEKSMVHYLRLPDPSEYSIIVRLMAYNMSDWMLTREWVMNAVVTPEEVGASQWLDRAISPYQINVTITQSAYPNHRPVSYDEMKTWPANRFAEHSQTIQAQPKPLCFAETHSLAGRWMLGPRHEHITHRWWSDSLWDDFDAIWAPYDCVLDQSLSVKKAVESVKWLSIIGDSNMRSLFTRLCELSQGQVYAGDQRISFMDLPKLCLLDSGAIVTYSSWFVAKKVPVYPLHTFGEQCTQYTEDLVMINKQHTIKGWPNCSLVSADIAAMEGPGLTYWGYGSHQAEGGANNERVEYFTQLFNHSYFVFNPTVFALTEDVDVSMIPEKFGSQFVYRNNERILAVNEQQISVIRSKVANGTWPVDTLTETNERVKGWLPVVDVFSPTHAASEVLHGDAVHFWWEVEATIAKFVTHFVNYAPQLKKGVKYANAEYAAKLREEVLAGPSDLIYKEPEPEPKPEETKEETKSQ